MEQAAQQSGGIPQWDGEIPGGMEPQGLQLSDEILLVRLMVGFNNLEVLFQHTL